MSRSASLSFPLVSLACMQDHALSLLLLKPVTHPKPSPMVCLYLPVSCTFSNESFVKLTSPVAHFGPFLQSSLSAPSRTPIAPRTVLVMLSSPGFLRCQVFQPSSLGCPFACASQYHIHLVFICDLFWSPLIYTSSIRFRKAWVVQGHSVEELPYRALGGVYGSWLGVILIIVVLIAQFYIVSSFSCLFWLYLLNCSN